MYSIFKKIVNIFFLIIMISLFVMSLCVHCEVNIYSYSLNRTIERHGIPLYLLLVLLSAVMSLLFYDLINRIMLKIKNPKVTAPVMLVVCALIVFVTGVFWIHFNDSLPKNDQADLFAEARKLAGYLQKPFDNIYMTQFKRQRGFTLLMAATLRIFGDTQLPVRYLNVMGVVALFIGIYKTVNSIIKEESYILFFTATLTLFYPMVIYTAFVYGTLLSLTFLVWGFYAVVKLCETEKMRYVVLAVISFPLGILMHQSAAVAAIAGIIYLFVHISRRNALKNCLSIVAIIFAIFLSMQLTNVIYEKLSGASAGDSIPGTATIYMGLNAETEEGGPGSQDGSFSAIFTENNGDAAATNKDAIGRIKVILLEYMTGKRSLSFFIRKTEYQWLDPTMGARKTILLNDVNIGEPPNASNFIRFYDSDIRDIIFKASDIYMILIYGFASVAGIFTLLTKNGTIENSSVHFLIQLFFIGGFAFQLMWESLSRYCFPYFVWLIPEAIYGVHQLYQLVCKIRKGYEYGENGKFVSDNSGL